MTNSSSHLDPHNKGLWFSLLAGPVIWSLHLVISYALVSISCLSGFLQGELLGISPAAGLVVLLTLVAAAVVAWAGWSAYRAWRQATDGNIWSDIHSLPPFMALAGMLISALFLVAILMGGIPALFLSCR